MRVAVTSTADVWPIVATVFQHAGLDPVQLPCIRVEPTDEAAATADRPADLVIITSRRALDFVWPDSAPAVDVAVVGRGTASRVTDRGGTVVAVSPDGVDELLRMLGADVRGKRVLFPRSDRAPASSVERLRAAGAVVDDPVVYRTVPIAPADDPVDAAAFASPSAVTGWTMARTLTGIVTAAIGSTTAAAILDAGGDDIKVAQTPGFEALAAALSTPGGTP